jgi:YfiH family protein
MQKIEYITPEIFPKDIILSGVTTKSTGEFAPFGYSISQSDILGIEETENNLHLFAKQFGIDRKKIKMKKQIHSDLIYIVNEDDESADGDGLITNQKGLLILVKVADCAGILLFDPINEVVAAIHSGWRGTQQQIVMKAIEMMYDNFGSSPLDLLAFISPCASKEKYEVGEDVAKNFPQSISSIGNGKYLFDNKNEIKLQILSMGINEKNIEISNICTIENEDYHSFRRDKEKSGRMAAFIMMIDK